MFELSIEFHRGAMADSEIEEIVGKPSVSAGTFLPTGTRDMQFEFESRVEAMKALRRLKARGKLLLSHWSIEPAPEEEVE